MKSFEHCENCSTFTGGNKFCGNDCKDEYHVGNIRMGSAPLEVLSILNERRNWVTLEYTSTVAALEHRNAPLLLVRNPVRRRHWLFCEAHILPNGERWLAYHREQESEAA